ncbi:[Fe-Fe] hydrogenase large subunit C-terminal domain-containing protein [Pectinatus brassicae]|uniref:Iron only hydrogenase large subunit-like protein n=1 Tax=Pectinatus brassicae TaxID=862415 RepID=A0A840UFK8_9FIRM|nr:[Fe-Fe] hydrogenase large subunit C-terminal domain-containing protein [Pectinatus brassicae]MBB5335789.1 iron only hydrogenase large subunit-like protein [Pectinatus brassicae]
MKTIQELYQEALQESSSQRDFIYDPTQLDCLFKPEKHLPEWKLNQLVNTDNTIIKTGKKISKDSLAVLQSLSLHKEKTAFVLIAPAFLGQFSSISPGMIRSAFKTIGFDGLLEVAVFADILTLKEALEFDHHIQTKQDFMLTSCCCPMWLAMIKKMYTTLIPNIPPSVSPMIAAGRTVKKLHSDALTVFVGPCIAKKAESREKDIDDAIDYVLTFQEAKEIFELLDIDLYAQKNSVKEFSSEAGRIYARAGGVSSAVKATLARLNPNRKIELTAKHADGIPACKQMMEDLITHKTTANFFEGMGCVGGCVGGPKSLIQKETARDYVNDYGQKSLYKTPLDNPYVLELLKRLDFTTLDDLLSDTSFFMRKINTPASCQKAGV